MVLSFRFLRMPRPTHFLGFFDLQNGAELILMSVLPNKVSGIYGILALFTGAEISALQLSMYIYSLLLGGTLILLAPRLHKRDALAAISFAYLYALDSLINALYTLLFGISWFLVLASSHHNTPGPLGAASKTIDNHAGFTSPVYNVSHVDVGQDAVAVVNTATEGSSAGTPFLGAGVMQPESATSILIISVLWVVRAYFILVVMAFARNVVRDHASSSPGEAPFSGRNGEGDGWQGRLGRALVSVNRGYWVGEEGWERFGNKFRRSEDGGRSSTASRRSSLPPV